MPRETSVASKTQRLKKEGIAKIMKLSKQSDCLLKISKFVISMKL